MKNLISKNLISIIILVVISAAALTAIPCVYAEQNTYSISNKADLIMAAQHPELDYELKCDVSADNVKIGTEDTPFTGTFNGNGYKLTNSEGVFGVIGNSGKIENIIVKGYLSDTNYGTISNCYINSGTVKPDNGGITGKNSGKIENCVSEYTEGASIAYVNEGTVQNCYSSSKIPLINENYTGTVTGCYVDSSAPAGVVNGSDTVTLLNESQLKQSASFAGWDFSNIWTTCGDTIKPVPISVIGRGIETEPYLIRDVNISLLNDLGCGENGKGRYFRLMENIHLKSLIGTEEKPFNGILDGGNYKNNSGKGTIFGVIGSEGIVSNLAVTVDNLSMHNAEIIGGIANKSYGTIKDCYVLAYFSNAGKDIGGIVGENVYGVIENCRTNIKISSSSTGIGGIAGYNNHGIIRGCSAEVSLNSTGNSIGGITGDNTEGIIENCRVTGSVKTGLSEAGGITGRLYNGTVKNCFADVELSKTENTGGIAGYIIESGSVENCYFNSEKAKTNCGIGSEDKEQFGVSSLAMRNKDTFSGWDFDGTWFMDGEYPELISVIGNGTKEHPYLIRNDTDWQLKGVKSLESTGNRLCYSILASGIGYTKSLGTVSDPFNGSVNGNGHFVSIIDVLGSDGYIANMNMNIDHAALTENRGTIEYCYFISDIVSTNNGGIIRGCAGKRIAEKNINGGIISNCFAFNDVLADTNNASSIENSVSLNGHYFVRKNDNGASIKNCAIKHNYDGDSVFVNENYATISNSTVIFSGKGETEPVALFAVRNNGTIENCRVRLPIGVVSSVAMMANGGGDVSFDENAALIMTSSNGKYNDSKLAVRNDNISDQIFHDISGHWAEETIVMLAEKGVINGYEDNTFRPDNSVTKGEFLKLLLEASKTPLDNTASPYMDANQSWAVKYVNTAFGMGITENINKNSSNFGVNDPITRLEAAVLAGRLIKPEGGMARFTDNSDIPLWAVTAVGASVESGIITGMPDGSFMPSNGLTRAQAATIVSRIMK